MSKTNFNYCLGVQCPNRNQCKRYVEGLNDIADKRIVSYIRNCRNTKLFIHKDGVGIGKSKERSDMMVKLRQIKEKHPNALILFRCGDFYNAYEDDAKACSRILSIKLTTWLDDDVRQVSFPHHALDMYLPKLIAAGKHVAICDM